MNKKERRQADIIKIVRTYGNLPAKKIASMLQVSQMTIYRDLKELGTRDEVAMAPARQEENSLDDTVPAYDLLRAIHESNDQKERIGKFAATLINQNDIVILDTGSTVDRMLRYIPENKNISVVCYNANVLAALRHKQGIKILFAGGIYHPNTELCESEEGIMFLNRHRANKVFLSAAGVHETLGVTCANEYEIATKKAILKSAPEHILLADSGKFGQVRSSYFCDLDSIHTVITDQKLSPEWRQILKDAEIPLHIV